MNEADLHDNEFIQNPIPNRGRPNLQSRTNGRIGAAKAGVVVGQFDL